MEDDQPSDLQGLKKGERLKKLREVLNLTQKEFAERIQIQQSYLSRIENGDKGLGKRLQKVILDEFRASPDWFDTSINKIDKTKARESNATDRGLLEGDFETYTTKSGNEYQIVSEGNHRLQVKVVEQMAYAGYLAGWSDPVYIENLPSTIITVKKFHTGTYRVFEVSGDSMDCDKKYAIENGDSVVAHKVERDFWKSKLHIKSWREWVIVHDEGIIVKHIVNHDVENCIITCRSYNEDKTIYPDFDLNLDDVYELYNVVKIEKNR